MSTIALVLHIDSRKSIRTMGNLLSKAAWYLEVGSKLTREVTRVPTSEETSSANLPPIHRTKFVQRALRVSRQLRPPVGKCPSRGAQNPKLVEPPPSNLGPAHPTQVRWTLRGSRTTGGLYGAKACACRSSSDCALQEVDQGCLPVVGPKSGHSRYRPILGAAQWGTTLRTDIPASFEKCLNHLSTRYSGKFQNNMFGACFTVRNIIGDMHRARCIGGFLGP